LLPGARPRAPRPRRRARRRRRHPGRLRPRLGAPGRLRPPAGPAARLARRAGPPAGRAAAARDGDRRARPGRPGHDGGTGAQGAPRLGGRPRRLHRPVHAGAAAGGAGARLLPAARLPADRRRPRRHRGRGPPPAPAGAATALHGPRHRGPGRPARHRGCGMTGDRLAPGDDPEHTGRPAAGPEDDGHGTAGPGTGPGNGTDGTDPGPPGTGASPTGLPPSADTAPPTGLPPSAGGGERPPPAAGASGVVPRPAPAVLDHRVLTSLLGAWALAACAPEEAAAVEDHLGECGSYADEALRLRAAVCLLQRPASLDVDPCLRTRVLDSCLERRPPRIPVPDWAAAYDAETARLDALLQ